MTQADDDDVVDRFNHRLAAIEADVKNPPQMTASGGSRVVWRSSFHGWLLVPTVIAIALVIAIASNGRTVPPGLASPPPAAVAGASAGATAGPGGGAPHLRISAYRWMPPEPPGIVIAPTTSFVHYTARVTNSSGDLVATMPIYLGPEELILQAGQYQVEISETTIIGNADNGAVTTSAPYGQCSIDLNLKPGTTTQVSASAKPGESCQFDPVIVSRTPAASAIDSPNPSAVIASLPPSHISTDQATELARAHVGPDATFVGVSSGPFRDVDLSPASTGPGFKIRPNQLVWAVRFTSEFSICNPIGVCYSPVPGVTVVYLDYLTGNFLASIGQSLASVNQ